MLTCPKCKGAGENFAVMCGPSGGRTGNVRCSTCKGAGVISEKHAAFIEQGEKMKQDRQSRDLSHREEAKRLGLSAAEYSRLEHGDLEAWARVARELP